MNKIQILQDYYKLLCSNKEINCVFCHSKAGYGKTYHTLKFLKDNNKTYVYNAGVTTAVELFKLLYNNRDKIVVLDDVESVLQDNRSINILKASTYSTNNKRIVTYKTSARVLKDYPDSFEFTGKIIILANNSFESKDLSYNALLSRCLKFELKFNVKELSDMSINILENKCIDIGLKNYLECLDLLPVVINKDFNFRLLNRLIEFVQFDIENALDLYINSIKEFETDIDPLDIIHEIVQMENDVKKQFELFKNHHNCSRATFFRFKQQYKKLKMEGYF